MLLKSKMLILMNLKRMLHTFGGKKERTLGLVKELDTVIADKNQLDAKTLMSIGNNHSFLNKIKVTDA